MNKAGTVFSRVLGGILIVGCLWISAAAQDELTITIARIAGTVEVRNVDEETGWEAAKTRQEISSGWQLRTAAESKVQLVFPRDNVVILRENSILYVDNLDSGGGASLGAEEGSLLVDIKNALAPGSEFELQTPTALAVVRGTKYGADDIDEYDVSFYGYSGDTEIFGVYGDGPVHLTAGYTVDVSYGNPPGEPYPSGDASAEFLSGSEEPGQFDETEEAAQALASLLSEVEAALLDIASQLADFEAEWARYERNDQVTHLTFLYAQLLALEEVLDGLQQQYEETVQQATDDGTNMNIDPIPELIAAIDGLFDDLRARIDDLRDDAGGVVIDDEDVLETLRGLIEQGDPVLGLRWGLLDSDNDGISDLDEVALGLDPLVNNADGFITLVDPPDDELIDYPDQDTVTFEFEALETDMIESYNLVLQSGGREWQRRDIDQLEDVDLLPLVTPGGAFAESIDSDGLLELEWFVTGDIAANQLFQQITAANPGFRTGLGNTIASEVRRLSIQTPVQEDVIVVDLISTTPQTIQVGQLMRVRGVISEVVNLGAWEIEVLYDSSLLDFQLGRRIGLFSESTVFFGDEPGGVVSVSGSVTRQSTGLTGDGGVFEIEFMPVEPGSTTIEIENLELTDAAGNPLDAEPGTVVEVEIV